MSTAKNTISPDRIKKYAKRIISILGKDKCQASHTEMLDALSMAIHNQPYRALEKSVGLPTEEVANDSRVWSDDWKKLSPGSHISGAVFAPADYPGTYDVAVLFDSPEGQGFEEFRRDLPPAVTGVILPPDMPQLLHKMSVNHLTGDVQCHFSLSLPYTLSFVDVYAQISKDLLEFGLIELADEYFEEKISDGKRFGKFGWKNLTIHFGDERTAWSMELPCSWTSPETGGPVLSVALEGAMAVIRASLETSCRKAIKDLE